MSAREEVRLAAAERQRRAADPAASAWVSANAGSGKTRVLIDRVARLLLAGADPARILCITYTRAAAAEMSARLFKRLGEWSMASDEALERAIHDIGAGLPRTRFKHARTLFARALETPGGLKIETIHAFCQRLLQRFPVEAGIAPGFSVIDDVESARLLEESRRELFRNIERDGDPGLAAEVARLLDAVGEASFGDILKDGIGARGKIEPFLQGHADIDAVVRASVGLGPADDLQTMFFNRASDPQFEENELRAVAQQLMTAAPKDAAMANAILAFADSQDRVSDFEIYESRYFRKVDDEPLVKLVSKATSDLLPGVAETLVREQNRLMAWKEKIRAARIADNSIAALKILERILANYRHQKRLHGALDYEDLIERTGALLRESMNAWVHYKLDGGIDHILIDEAQDTSPQQWNIVGSLADEFFAIEAQIDPRHRTMFAVGDQKQSIYSFQGADPKGFVRMSRRFGLAVTQSNRNWLATELHVSFRSTREVLAAVDAAFDSDDGREALSDEAAPVRHEAERIGEYGLVELWEAQKKDATDISVYADWTKPVDQRPESAPEVVLAGRIAGRIRRWIEEGARLANAPGPQRVIEPGDILILVRQRRALYYEMIRALNLARLPVAGSDRMNLRNEIAFRDLDALGRFCLFPDDNLALAEVLKGPFIGFGDDELLEIAPGRKGALWQALQSASGAEFEPAREWLRRAIQDAQTRRPFEFYERALSNGVGALSPRQRFAERLGLEAEDVIAEFLSLALEFERDHAATLQGFLAYADESAGTIKRDMEEAHGRVRVMTVHGAKGLEAPIVFLIDTCSAPQAPKNKWLLETEATGGAPLLRVAKKEQDPVAGRRAQQELKRQAAEYRRQLYVAMTRARDRLYVCGVRSTRNYGGSWHELLWSALGTLPDMARIAGASGTILRLGREPEGTARRESAMRAATDLPNWAKRPAPREQGALRRTPSALLASEELGLPPVLSPRPVASDPFLRGRAIHRLLQFLPECAIEQRDKRARKLLSLPAFRALDDGHEEIIGEVQALLGDGAFARIFGPGSLAEVAISGVVKTKSGRPLFISGQIDRLLVTPNEILVVDFKTNRPAPRSQEDVPRAYLAQMAAYALLLSNIFPGRVVRPGLLFTALPRLLPLDVSAIDVTGITEED